MYSIVRGLDVLAVFLRIALFAVGVLVAAVAGLSYAVRTRRLNPFSPVSRFVRGSVDPLFAPVERRVVRAGGRPATAPWWALATVVVGGLILVSLVGFLRGQVAMAGFLATRGATGIAILLVSWTFGLLQLALMVRVLSSWFPGAAYSPWVRWSYPLTDWFLRPLRQIVPTLGMIDVTPIVAYFALSLVERGVLGLLG